VNFIVYFFKNKKSMDRCAKDIEDLDKLIRNIKESDGNRLQQEYEKMLENLKRVETERAIDRAWANPVLPNAILEESVPGTIRNGRLQLPSVQLPTILQGFYFS
jgi:DNA excision repair protein ERCC-2